MLYRFTGILLILFQLYLNLRVKDMKINALFSYTIEEATFKLYPKDRNFSQIYANVDVIKNKGIKIEFKDLMLSVNGTYDNQPVYIQADIPSFYFIFNITIFSKSNKKPFLFLELNAKADIIDIDSVISEESIKIYKNWININNSKLRS